jgi:hypothetical protein
MGQFKPPSSLSGSNSHLFLVGRDSHGSGWFKNRTVDAAAFSSTAKKH